MCFPRGCCMALQSRFLTSVCSASPVCPQSLPSCPAAAATGRKEQVRPPPWAPGRVLAAGAALTPGALVSLQTWLWPEGRPRALRFNSGLAGWWRLYGRPRLRSPGAQAAPSGVSWAQTVRSHCCCQGPGHQGTSSGARPVCPALCPSTASLSDLAKSHRVSQAGPEHCPWRVATAGLQ